jgi:hypothetical protein
VSRNDPARPTARRIFLCARHVNQITFARRGRRYHHLCRFTAAARGFHISGLLRRRYPCSRPGTSPWLGPPAVESWSDLSGAPTCAPDFLRARAMRVRMMPTPGAVTLTWQAGLAGLLVELRPTPA